jgi:hypothetical protein
MLVLVVRDVQLHCELLQLFVEYKQQSKMLLKKLNHSSPVRCSIATSNNYVFQYEF